MNDKRPTRFQPFKKGTVRSVSDSKPDDHRPNGCSCNPFGEVLVFCDDDGIDAKCMIPNHGIFGGGETDVQLSKVEVLCQTKIETKRSHAHGQGEQGMNERKTTALKKRIHATRPATNPTLRTPNQEQQINADQRSAASI